MRRVFKISDAELYGDPNALKGWVKDDMIDLLRYFDSLITKSSGKYNKSSLFVRTSLSLDFKINLTQQIKISTKVPRNDDIFSFGKLYESEESRSISKDVIAFSTSNASVIGIYVIEDNTLITSDLAYSEKGKVILKEILDYLVGNGYIIKKEVGILSPKIFNITIGCDPEFEVKTRSGDIINCRGSEGFEAFKSGGDEQIGLDGAGHQLEIRPKPMLEGNIDKFIDGIKDLFSEVQEYSANSKNNFLLSVGGDSHPLGGHIHVGVNNEKCTPSDELISLLDHFVGHPFIELSGKARKNYKKIHCQQVQDWGFEYRTPPSCIFANPKITSIITKCVYNLVNNWFTQMNFSIKNFEHPTPTEYKEYTGLSNEETKYVFDFISNYKKHHKDTDVLAAWSGTNKHLTKTISPISLVFNDGWDDEVKRLFTEYIKSKFLGLTVSKTTRITLFGLNTERNDEQELYGISVDGIKVRKGLSTKNSIGLSYIFRHSTVLNYEILDAIVAFLEERVVSHIELTPFEDLDYMDMLDEVTAPLESKGIYIQSEIEKSRVRLKRIQRKGSRVCEMCGGMMIRGRGESCWVCSNAPRCTNTINTESGRVSSEISYESQGYPTWVASTRLTYTR